MMKKFLLPLFLGAVIFMNAQSVYVFETENIAYENLIGSTSLNNGGEWDDPAYQIPLGFDFQIGSQVFNTIYIIEWGPGGILSSRPDDNGIQPLLIPIGQDIIDLRFGTGTSQSNISYKSEGTSGNRILKIEWNNVGFLDDGTGLDFMNLQVWLYEASNIIEYRYGPSSIDNPVGSFEEETGPVVNFATSINMDDGQLLGEAYILLGEPENPVVLVIEPGDEFDGGTLEGMIPNGTVYRFLPRTLLSEDFSKVDFQIFPNPTRHYLNIKTVSSNYSWIIYNSLGQKMNTTSSENKIDVSNLTNGIYFLKIETETGSLTKKFLKQ